MAVRRVKLNDLRDLTDGSLRDLARIWMDLRGEETVPFYRDFDVLEVPDLMPCLWVCDSRPEVDPPGFVYRLAGEQVNEIYGGSLRGRRLDEIIPADSYPVVYNRYRNVIDIPALSVTTGRIYLHNDRLMLGERLILPFRSRDGRLSIVMGATVVTEEWDYLPRDEAAKQHQTTVTPVAFDPDDPGTWREGFKGERLF